MKIDRYEAEVEKGGRVVYYAIAGKKKIPMPDCYKEMYDDEHLAVKEVELTRPELYGDDVPARHHIPLRTV